MVREVTQADRRLIDEWRAVMNLDPLEFGWLPETGFMACDESGNALACTFLLETDTTVAQLEGTHGDPHADPVARNEAVGRASMAACDFARDRGYKTVIAFTESRRIAERAVTLGWAHREAVTHFVRFDLDLETDP